MATVGLIRNSAQNYLINGNFDIWQRTTSVTSIGNVVYGPDRFVYSKSGAMIHNLTRDTDVPTVAQSGIKSNYSLRLTLTTPDTAIAAGDHCRITQHVEGYNFTHFAEQIFTISFWVKATLPGVYCVAFRNDGNDRSYVAEYTINATDTWEKKALVISASPSDGTWNYTNGRGVSVTWSLAGGTTHQATPNAWQTGNLTSTANQVNGVNTGATDFRLAQVMINPGVAPAKFSLAGGTIGGELELCQRYYEKTYDLAEIPGISTTSAGVKIFLLNQTVSNLNTLDFNQFKIGKPAAPSITIYRDGATAAATIRTPGGGSLAVSSINIGQTAFNLTNNSGVSHAPVNGVYSYHWVADAEL